MPQPAGYWLTGSGGRLYHTHSPTLWERFAYGLVGWRWVPLGGAA